VKEDRRYRADARSSRRDQRGRHLHDGRVRLDGKEQKEIVRIEAFWIDTWLRSQYRNIEVRYIVHDAAAKEVDQHTFFHLRESAARRISSAYSLCAKLIEEQFPPSEWNIYPFHFSDGDNWSGRDTERCVQLLKERILPAVNVFCYGR
jgi:uncharacterized sporulation protein YeaH/YhbH (DUF444 family)